MSEAPDNHELARQFAVLEERMKTMQAEYRTDIARLAEDMAKRDAARSERDATARWWQTTIIIGAVAVALGVAGLVFG